MTTNKHTPGPWQHCSASDGRCICGRIYSPSADAEVAVLAGDEGAPTGEERAANTAVIVAAPDMLAALEMGSVLDTPSMIEWAADRLVLVYGENENADFIQSMRNRAAVCRAAMKKARGEQ